MGELNFILAVFLKPAVLFLDELVLIPLWKIRHKKGVKILMGSIIAFLVGELLCARDVYILRRMTYFDEAGHDIFMMVAFALAFWAFFHIFQADIACWLKKCPILRKDTAGGKEITSQCIQRNYISIFAGWSLLFAALVAIMPVFANKGILRSELEVSLFGRRIASFLYDRSASLSVLQQKIFPLISCFLLFCSGILSLSARRLNKTVIWLGCFGMGALAFTYFRLVLVHFFHPQATLTAFWEELLEMLYICFIFLWIKIGRGH